MSRNYHDEKGMKMDVILTDDDKITFGIYDLLQAMGEDAKQRMGEYLACEPEIWNEITRMVNEEYAGINMNPNIFNLRKAFVTSSHFPDNITKLVKDLLDENLWLRKEVYSAERTAYNWEQWWRDRNPNAPWSEEPVKNDRANRTYLKDTLVHRFFKEIGIDLGEIQEQLENENNS